MDDGRSFVASSPLSQPLVEGILGLHWQAWEASRLEACMVAFLRSDYQVQFQDFPPVLQKPKGFPFYNCRSVKAQALQGEIPYILV